MEAIAIYTFTKEGKWGMINYIQALLKVGYWDKKKSHKDRKQ